MAAGDIPNHGQSYNEAYTSCVDAAAGSSSTSGELSGTEWKQPLNHAATTGLPCTFGKRRRLENRYSGPLRKASPSTPFRKFLADKSSFKEIVHRFTGEVALAHPSPCSRSCSAPFSTCVYVPQCCNHRPLFCRSNSDGSSGNREDQPTLLPAPHSPSFRNFVADQFSFKELVHRFTGEPAWKEPIIGGRNIVRSLSASTYAPPCLNHGTTEKGKSGEMILSVILQSLCVLRAVSSYLLRQCPRSSPLQASRVQGTTPQTSIQDVNVSTPHSPASASMSD
ncbi:hypothetical protein KP509_36G044600 [Ceratopteris richardii]|uniref:Uncharacterized protein n=1 Tax=Ceratopteris richardii TaxID=49495 RepID=A0A8T2QCR4_CERRI|nr:hypothetical protein KP509_36G044600 [Ceratopteris richardii]